MSVNPPVLSAEHLSHTFIDREGRIRNIYSSGTLDPRLVLADAQTLMLETNFRR